jgi:hypothetical protein
VTILGKKFYSSLKIGPNYFLLHFKYKIILNFVKILVRKQGMTTNFLSPLSFVAVFGSGIRDPGSRMGKIWIRDKHPGPATLPAANQNQYGSTALIITGNVLNIARDWIRIQQKSWGLRQRCGTLTTFYGSGSDF